MSKRVSSSLHSELTEYASLLRSLRATHTSDLTAHLSQPQSTSSQLGDEDGEEDEENVDIVENNRYPLPFTAVGTHSGTRDSPFSVSSTESPIPVDIEPLAYPSDDGEEMEM